MVQIAEVMENLPVKHQTLLFSATMPEEIEKLANQYLTKPVRIKVTNSRQPPAPLHDVLHCCQNSH